MTPIELAAALAECSSTFSCHVCGGKWIIHKDGPAVLFHRCRRSQETFSRYAGVEERNAEDRRAWAERALGMNRIGEALEDELGERALLPIEDD